MSTHPHTCTHVGTQGHTHQCACIHPMCHTSLHTSPHMLSHRHHTYMSVHSDIQGHTCASSYTNVCAQSTHVLAHMHTYSHTYVHSHTHTHSAHASKHKHSPSVLMHVGMHVCPREKINTLFKKLCYRCWATPGTQHQGLSKQRIHTHKQIHPYT